MRDDMIVNGSELYQNTNKSSSARNIQTFYNDGGERSNMYVLSPSQSHTKSQNNSSKYIQTYNENADKSTMAKDPSKSC